MNFPVKPGQPHPLGATVDDHGVNFAVFSQHANSVTLLVFEAHDSLEPVQEVPLSRTFHFWHAHLEGLGAGAHYAFRVDGPWDPDEGHRFNRNRVLVDPYSKGNNNALWNRGDAGDTVSGTDIRSVDNLAHSLRSAVIDPRGFDWGSDVPLLRPMQDSVLYEMHLGGFTKHPNSGVQHPGTFLGAIEKIPYLKELGITAVELLPVFEFDEKDILRHLPDGTELRNFWGYSTMSFFAPHPGFCVNPQECSRLDEFRQMVKAFHEAGIEVVLDVVFNHTDEGNHEGTTINFKGIDNRVYYHLVQDDRRHYMDYTGTGNTFNCNHPIGAKLIVECLEYWVREMHVDGFRFDEGTILVRDTEGKPTSYAPVVWNIELSETLADAKLITEAWDAGGEYEIGRFPGFRWAEWNGFFRDDVRKFVKGDPGGTCTIETRIAGSSDLYEASGHQPTNSINFVVCHDGYTLNDLVSYQDKHNEANGEENRDGIQENLSWNCGVEGPTADRSVEDLREKQIRNFTAIQLLSQGVPMILSGDEVRRTQGGNNNAYCQDNEISWFDWSLREKNGSIFEFFKRMIAFRMRNACLRRDKFFGDGKNSRGVPDIAWHGTAVNQPNWSESGTALAFTLGGVDREPDLHVILNQHQEDQDFELPQLPGRSWKRAVDTRFSGRDAIAEPGHEEPVHGSSYRAQGRSVVVLVSGNLTRND